jgi:hypothetical protein
MDEIVFRLKPFEVLERPSDAAVNSLFSHRALVNAMWVDWCGFPDILFVENTLEFVGVSFPLCKSHEHLVKEWIGDIADQRCQYVGVDERGGERYAGFGSNNRLELYWTEHFENVLCEPASLDMGAWIFPQGSGAASATLRPLGFGLLAIDDIAEAHRLRKVGQ